MMTAVATTAATIATISVTNAALNADSLREADDVGKTTLKDTTSKEALQSYVIAALTAGATQYGADVLKLNSSVPASASTTTRVATNTLNAITRSSIQTSTQIAATSIVKGQSLSQTIEDQGGLNQVIKNTVAMSFGEAGSKEIGFQYHNYNISQPTQLALHGIVGATTSTLMGGDALSGAAAGIAGEYTADSLYQNGTNANYAIALGQTAGSGAALLTSLLQGRSDEQTATNIQTGSFVASNAAIYNTLQIQAQRVAGTKNHLTIVHTPEEQALYANQDGYVQDKESKLWIRTWGAGGSLGPVGELVSENNRPRDRDLSIKNYTSSNLVPLSQEGYYVQLLNDLDKNYQDNLKYNLFPNPNSSSGYNSNSYVSGLLIAADIVFISIPDKKINYQWQGWEYDNSPSTNINYTFPFQVPGYEKPVPSQYFKTNQ
jgi:hypothetical protein